MAFIDLECPNCGAPELEPGEDQQLVCPFCGSVFGDLTRVCPGCGHYNEAGVRHCVRCGLSLVRDCPACGADNWVLAEHCTRCGRDLDLIERLASRWQQTTQERLYERRTAVAELKEQEERASQARMAGLMDVERRRQEALARARVERRERDRQVYTLVVVAFVIFVVVVLVTLLLTAGGS